MVEDFSLVLLDAVAENLRNYDFQSF